MAVPARDNHLIREKSSSPVKVDHWESFDGEARLHRLQDFNRLLSIMIHQTRNYCMSAKGYVSLLECDGMESEKSGEWLSKISRGMNCLEDFLNQFETYRPSRNPGEQGIGVKNEVREVWAMVSEQSTKEIVFDITVDEEVEVIGDPGDFKKMVHHLLKNSMEAIEDRGKISMDLSPVETIDGRKRGWILEFQDNGCGMSEDELSRAGQLLYTTKRGHVGCGLNLATAVIRRIGATVGVWSKQGVGTLIRIKKVD